MVKDTLHIRNLIKVYTTRFPEYLDYSDYSDKQVFCIMQSMYNILLKLISDRILSDNNINNLRERFRIEFERICLTTNHIDLLLIHTDIFNNINEILEESENFELYETCHNIKRFKTNL